MAIVDSEEEEFRRACAENLKDNAAAYHQMQQLLQWASAHNLASHL